MTDHPTHITGPIADGDTITITVDAPPPPPPPTSSLTFSSTIADGAALSGAVQWVATVLTGTAKNFDFSIDGVVLWPELSAPWGGTLDTTTISDGMHILTVTGYDMANVAVVNTANVTVSNSVPTSIYGPAINADTKDNIRVGPSPNALVGIKFLCSQTSSLTSVRFSQRWGSGYSLGSGGTMKVSIRDDNGGVPTNTDRGSMTFVPGNPGTATSYDNKTLTTAVSTTAGQRYWVIFQNTDANPNSNYISINGIYVYSSSPLSGQRQPRFADADYGVYISDGTTWTIQSRDTPVVDISYANGKHDGMGFIGMIGINGQAVYAGLINGAKSVREHFTPTATRSVTEAHVRVRRVSGGDPLTIAIKQGNTVLKSGTVASTSVPASTSGGDNGGSVWVSVTFASQSLVAGTVYDLVLTTPSTSTYTAAPIREGTDSGFAASLSFPDGIAQESTNGTTWTDMYASSRLSLQFYLK